MFDIKGKYTEAKIFIDTIEPEAISQVYGIVSHPAFENESVRIMPDVHAGKGCVIGFTSTMSKDMVIPNLIGVDIGCGMKVVKLGKIDLDLIAIDRFIRHKIPSGNSINAKVLSLVEDYMESAIGSVCAIIGDDESKENYHLRSLGSLGGGNHFIEISVDKDNNKYLIIHSGSRNFGHRIATYFQKLAKIECDHKYPVDKELTFLQGESYHDYMYCMRTAQDFAVVNRDIMAKRILDEFNIVPESEFENIHNYIDEFNIIRKGAVSALKDELLLIPMNMRDGSILAKGKGNADWNNSAPHGAGRLMSRSKAKELLDLDEFNKQMEGIYTTSVSSGTLDEAPMAYKPMEDILNNIGDTVEVLDILKPIHNFKAH